ncbi:hypothetical protein HYC85_020871 [Camellia sinensis]|uniref:Major facilitator superfamily (MFS) profile domain-containing protein n=1 Tax=Camellia sinensis TaxID=4442 RepID=A0A7J7GR19_CAMSI|nr:hypothetical protein HYC85_020871 [Camellia sinensis]
MRTKTPIMLQDSKHCWQFAQQSQDILPLSYSSITLAESKSRLWASSLWLLPCFPWGYHTFLTARFRSTCHGISGAFGKIGAIVGSIGFYWASQQNEENDHSNANRITAGLVILGGACIVGVITTRLFTHETMGRSLDDNENDDVA